MGSSVNERLPCTNVYPCFHRVFTKNVAPAIRLWVSKPVCTVPDQCGNLRDVTRLSSTWALRRSTADFVLLLVQPPIRALLSQRWLRHCARRSKDTRLSRHQKIQPHRSIASSRSCLGASTKQGHPRNDHNFLTPAWAVFCFLTWGSK